MCWCVLGNRVQMSIVAAWCILVKKYSIVGQQKGTDISDIRSKVADIRKLTVVIYDRPVISEPIIEIVVPTVYMDNIRAIPHPVDENWEDTSA